MTRNSKAQTAMQCDSTEATAAPAAAFSRSMGLPAAMGKGTEKLHCKVPDVVKKDVKALAASLGLNESEWMRWTITCAVYGVEEAERMHSGRFQLVTRKGHE